MQEDTFSELNGSEVSVRKMLENDKELNVYMVDFLVPRLAALSRMLSGIKLNSKLTFDRYGVPALKVHLLSGEDITATFLCEFSDECSPVMLRLSCSTEGTDGEQKDKELVVFYEGVADTSDGFLDMLSVLARDTKVLPGNDQMDKIPGDVTEYSEEISSIKSRLACLAEKLQGQFPIEDVGIVNGELPYLLIAGEDIAAALCYETLSWNNDLYLLHIRMDLPFEETSAGITAEEFCDGFNKSGLFVKAYVTTEAPVFFVEEDAGEYITFHICIPEREEFLTAEAYKTMFATLKRVSYNPVFFM